MSFSWSWITDNLATGGKIDSSRDVAELVEAGVTHVLNLRELDEWEYMGGPLITARMEDLLFRQAFAPAVAGQTVPGYCHNPIADNGQPIGSDWFRRSLDFTLPALKAGGKVYQHCSMGYNRGPSTAFCTLRALGWAHGKALRRVRFRRPITLFPGKSPGDGWTLMGIRYWPDAERALADLTPYLSGLGYQFPPWP